MDDEDDVNIVQEIPVFLSKALQDNLFIFQYPIKSNQTNFDTAQVVNCCVKPINQEVKVDFALNVESQHYDTFKGEHLALVADGKNQSKGERPTFRQGLMDKLSYTSTKSIDNINKYVVGILQDGEVHLSPLQSVLQLRPSFSYFDKEDKRIKAEQKASRDIEEEEELQQVTVKFSRTDTERLKKAREKTYDYYVKKSADEPWCETLWHTKNTAASELEKQKLFATQNESLGQALSLSNKQYVEKLIPPERYDQSLESILPPKVISKAKLKKLTVMEQIKIILKDAKMMTFNGLLSILKECDSEITPEKLRSTLPHTAVLIRGNWVAQSDVLFPPESVSNINGVPADLMIRGRDYILYQFSKQDHLYRRKVIQSTQLPYEEVFDILQSVARLNAEKKWELLLPPDPNYEAKNSDLVQRQEILWSKRENEFNDMDSDRSPKRMRKRSIREIKVEKLTNGV